MKVELFTCLYLAYLNDCKTFEGNSIRVLQFVSIRETTMHLKYGTVYLSSSHICKCVLVLIVSLGPAEVNHTTSFSARHPDEGGLHVLCLRNTPHNQTHWRN